MNHLTPSGKYALSTGEQCKQYSAVLNVLTALSTTEQCNLPRTLPVADLLTDCDQSLALRHSTFCILHTEHCTLCILRILLTVLLYFKTKCQWSLVQLSFSSSV